MNCPKCHGKGEIVEWIVRPRYGLDTARWTYIPCDYPGCHAGQLSCSEGSERTGGVTDSLGKTPYDTLVEIFGKPATDCGG